MFAVFTIQHMNAEGSRLYQPILRLHSQWATWEQAKAEATRINGVAKDHFGVWYPPCLTWNGPEVQ